MPTATMKTVTVTAHAAPCLGRRLDAIVTFEESIGSRTFAVSAVDPGTGAFTVTSVQATEGPRREVRRGKMRDMIATAAVASVETREQKIARLDRARERAEMEAAFPAR